MWLVNVKEALHPILNDQRHVPEPGMINPVLGSIRNQGGFPDAPVDAVAQF